MKHLFFCLLIAVMLLTASAASANSPIEGYVPNWKVGDFWTLEATYRDLKSEGEIWMAPVEWVFRVRAVKQVKGIECYVIHVYSRKKSIRPQAVLWLSKAELRPVKVIDIFETPNGIGHSERDIDPQEASPLVADGTIVPYDLPVFPLNKANSAVQGADGFGAYRSQASEKKFAKISKVGGLSFKRVIGQKNKTPEKQYADTFAAYRSSGQSFQVEIAEERSSTNITQLWQQGSPWAISSENRDRKVRLLPPVPQNQGEPHNNGGEF